MFGLQRLDKLSWTICVFTPQQFREQSKKTEKSCNILQKEEAV
jgi:hypothetical protein